MKAINRKYILSALIAFLTILALGMLQAYDKGKEQGIEQTTNAKISQVDCTVKPCLIFFISDQDGTVTNYKDLLK